MKQWNRLIVSFQSVESTFIDYVNYLLFEFGAIGTEVKYAQDYLDNHPHLFGEIPLALTKDELDHWVEIWGYFEEVPDDATIKQISTEIQAFTTEAFEVNVQTIEDDNWQKNWMQYYQVERISRHIVVVPAWLDYRTAENEQVIVLDPGIAFGTGNHPTTRLGGQALSLYMQAGDRVLDVGTGTGILSFIAATLGASQIEGYDLDPQAIVNANENLLLQTSPSIQNLVTEEAIHFGVNDLMNNIHGPFDIIVANILPHILVNMMEDAYRELKDEGYLILGGILEEKAPEIEATISQNNFHIIQKNQMGEWLCYVAQKGEST